MNVHQALFCMGAVSLVAVVTSTVQEYKVIEGKAVQLECEMTCNGTHWTGPDNTIKGDKSVLTLCAINRSENGNYTCHDKCTTNKTSYHVDVLYPPQIHLPQNMSVVSGRVLNIDCSKHVTDGKPRSYNYTWTGPFRTFHGSNLTIENVNKSHDGVYTCQVWNIMEPSMEPSVQGTYDDSVGVEVLYAPEIAGDFPKIVIGQPGERVVMRVDAEAKPLPDYFWSKDNKTNLGDNTCHVMKNELWVYIRGKEDYGIYKVNVSNDLNHSIQIYNLTANAAPFPVNGFTITDIADNIVTFDWTLSYDGGAKALYHVEYSKVPGDTEWHPACTVSASCSVSASRCRCEIEDLQAGSVYNFRMYGNNTFGEGERSDNVTAKTEGILTLYHGIGFGAAGCLVLVLFIICMAKLCCCCRRDEETAGRLSISAISPVSMESTSNHYECVRNSETGGGSGIEASTYDVLDDGTEHERRRVRHQKKAVIHRVKTKKKMTAPKQEEAQSRDEVTCEGNAYEELPDMKLPASDSQREDMTYNEYEFMPELPTHRKLRKHSRDISQPVFKPKVAKRSLFPGKSKTEKVRCNVEPTYIDKGHGDPTYANDHGGEPGYLDMEQVRVATVTETYEDMTRDFYRKRRSRVLNILKSKKSPQKKVEYMNVTEMNTNAPFNRNSDEPLLYINVKESEKRSANRQQQIGNPASNRKKKARFPFFKRNSRNKEPPNPHTSRESSARESSAYVDAHSTWDNMASGCSDNNDRIPKETDADIDDASSVCSRTTDSLCDEMMEQVDLDSLHVDIHSSASGQSIDCALVVKTRVPEVRDHTEDSDDGDVL